MAVVHDQRSNKYQAVGSTELTAGTIYRVRSTDAQHGVAVIGTSVAAYPVLVLETGQAVPAAAASNYAFEQAEAQVVLTA